MSILVESINPALALRPSGAGIALRALVSSMLVSSTKYFIFHISYFIFLFALSSTNTLRNCCKSLVGGVKAKLPSGLMIKYLGTAKT